MTGYQAPAASWTTETPYRRNLRPLDLDSDRRSSHAPGFDLIGRSGLRGWRLPRQPSVGIETLRNPEPLFFILGAKSYGRLNTFLLRTGYEQIDQLAAAYAVGSGLLPAGT